MKMQSSEETLTESAGTFVQLTAKELLDLLPHPALTLKLYLILNFQAQKLHSFGN